MSKHRNKHLKNDVQKPEVQIASGIVTTFSEKIGVSLKNTSDLMNWIVFGDTKAKFNYQNDNEF